MPDENELESATNLAVTLAWVAGAVVAAWLLGVVLTWVLMRIGRRRARAFDETDDREDDFVKPNGRG